jgi:hypothetical protein
MPFFGVRGRLVGLSAPDPPKATERRKAEFSDYAGTPF